VAVTTGPVYIETPPTPAVPRYGLFTVATGPLDLPVHARNGGLQYQVATCELPDGYAVACTPATKTFDAGPATITGNPFVVLSTFTCGTVGMTEERARELVVARLKAGEQAAVEAIFSAQANGQSPGLSNNAAVVTLAAATTIPAAISALEDWLYSRYGLPGVIHAPASVGAWMMDHTQMIKDGQIWRTPLGTAVSFGNYAGTSAVGAAPAANHEFLYITGQVAVWRTPDSEIFVSPYGQTINRSTNQMFMVAEREYVVTFDCFVATIDATLA